MREIMKYFLSYYLYIYILQNIEHGFFLVSPIYITFKLRKHIERSRTLNIFNNIGNDRLIKSPILRISYVSFQYEQINSRCAILKFDYRP